MIDRSLAAVMLALATSIPTDEQGADSNRRHEADSPASAATRGSMHPHEHEANGPVQPAPRAGAALLESTLETVRAERDRAEREIAFLRSKLRDLCTDLNDRLLPVHSAEMIALEAVEESEGRYPLGPDVRSAGEAAREDG